MLKIQNYLKSNPLESLENDFGIVIKRYDRVITLNYSQIDSPKFNPMVDECRGLILNLYDYSVLSRPFDRFYNLGEGDTGKDVDVSKMTVLDKEDGSFIQVYFNGKWNVGTRKMAFAEGTAVTGTVFRDLFINTIGLPVEKLMDGFNPNFTYIFELCTPENRVVKRYEKPTVYLIGAREKFLGYYSSYDTLCQIVKDLKKRNANVEVPKKYTFTSFSDIKIALNELPELDEGFVCWNEFNGFRIKIKSPTYVAIHHLRNNGELSPKNISVLVFANEYSEYLSYYPEDRQFFQPYIDAYERMKNDIKEIYNKYKDIEVQKDFALSIMEHPAKPVLFSLRKGLSLDKIFDNINDNKKLELLERYK